MDSRARKKRVDSRYCSNKSVGILVWRDEKLLLIERNIIPYGLAPPAGHIEKGDTYESAAEGELSEEAGMEVTSLKLLYQGRKENKCVRENGNWHYWKIFKAKAKGEPIPAKKEAKKAGWYSKDQIESLADRTRRYLKGKISEKAWETDPGIEVIWLEFFKELEIL